jgi:hypothetical protein
VHNKGHLGHPSKIREQSSRFLEALDQGAEIMALVELAGLHHAMVAYLATHHPSITLDDLRLMPQDYFRTR